MDNYFNILQEKAKKINANVEFCGFDKECIKDVLAAKVRSNLENEDINIIKEKALELKINISKDSLDKNELLNLIENKIKEILEEENERFTSMELQQSFMPLDLT